jgi:hypothetical protein
LIRIAITEAAFEAIAATLPLGSVRYENATNGALRALRLAAADVVELARASATSSSPLAKDNLSLAGVGMRSDAHPIVYSTLRNLSAA